MVAYVYNPSTWKVETEDQAFKANLGHMKPYLENAKQVLPEDCDGQNMGIMVVRRIDFRVWEVMHSGVLNWQHLSHHEVVWS